MYETFLCHSCQDTNGEPVLKESGETTLKLPCEMSCVGLVSTEEIFGGEAARESLPHGAEKTQQEDWPYQTPKVCGGPQER